MSKQIFVNLPVTDLKKSVIFYEAVGFKNNPQFTDDTAACMVWSDTIYVMLLTHDKLRQFTTKDIADATKSVEVSLSLSMDDLAAVQSFVAKALGAGGIRAGELEDYGFMQQWGVDDPDGHHWEAFYMDMSKFPVT